MTCERCLRLEKQCKDLRHDVDFWQKVLFNVGKEINSAMLILDNARNLPAGKKERDDCDDISRRYCEAQTGVRE